MTEQILEQHGEARTSALLASSRREAELRGRVAQLSEKVEELSESLRASEGARAVLESEVEHLRRENQAIHTSMSWRVTRPLRVLRGGA